MPSSGSIKKNKKKSSKSHKKSSKTRRSRRSQNQQFGLFNKSRSKLRKMIRSIPSIRSFKKYKPSSKSKTLYPYNSLSTVYTPPTLPYLDRHRPLYLINEPIHRTIPDSRSPINKSIYSMGEYEDAYV